MQTSIAVTNFSWPPGATIPVELVEVAQLADQRRIDSMFLSDHLVQAEPGTVAKLVLIVTVIVVGAVVLRPLLFDDNTARTTPR